MFLRAADLPIDVPIRAQDIMRAPLMHVYRNTPIRDAARQMLAHRLEAVPVLNDANHVIGEITTDILFKFGLPDFFSQLKSVSFISEFDPFEKYFEREAHSTVGDLMQPAMAVMSPQATLLEIVFALAVRHAPKIYIVRDDDALIGVIDRIAVLDNVINL